MHDKTKFESSEQKKVWETPKMKRVGIVDTTRSGPFTDFPSRSEDSTYNSMS